MGRGLRSIEPGKHADFVVIKGKTGDPYAKLLKTPEDDIQLVFINGVPRFGAAALMDRATAAILPNLLPALASRKIGGHAMKFNFVHESADSLVASVTLAVAQQRLSDALCDLPELASGLARSSRRFLAPWHYWR